MGVGKGEAICGVTFYLHLIACRHTVAIGNRTLNDSVFNLFAVFVLVDWRSLAAIEGSSPAVAFAYRLLLAGIGAVGFEETHIKCGGTYAVLVVRVVPDLGDRDGIDNFWRAGARDGEACCSIAIDNG